MFIFRRYRAFQALVSLFLLWASLERGRAQSLEPAGIDEAVETAVAQLLQIQNEDGSWPYEGVYRVNRKIPMGYRIGGTAICCEALLYSTKVDDEKANDAIGKGVARIIEELKHPTMKPIKPNRYDVRIWGHVFALDLFCRIKIQRRLPELDATLGQQIERLTEAVLFQQIPETGGWNYANGRAQASFVTAPAAQALLWAHQCGQQVPAENWTRIARAMNASRHPNVAFTYSGPTRKNRETPIQSSIARSANCEATLYLLGAASNKKVKLAIDKFHEHWDELEKRRKKNGTHEPPFGIAPYYFYYAHRYAAFAINCLPEASQAEAHRRLRETVMRTRDEDGTWNDRVFPRSRAYGTAMSVLALLGKKVPSPEAVTNREPAAIDPDLTFYLSTKLLVTFGKKQIELAEFKDWLAREKFDQPPFAVLIKIDGDVKTTDAQLAIAPIQKKFPDAKVYVGIRE